MPGSKGALNDFLWEVWNEQKETKSRGAAAGAVPILRQHGGAAQRGRHLPGQQAGYLAVCVQELPAV